MYEDWQKHKIGLENWKSSMSWSTFILPDVVIDYLNPDALKSW